MNAVKSILKLIVLTTMDFLSIKTIISPTMVSKADKNDESTLQKKYLASMGGLIISPILAPSFIVFSILISDISETTRLYPLDQFFTLQLAIRPNYKLIESGPYSFIVRHGSCTAVIVSIIRNADLSLNVGSSFTVCGWTTSPWFLKVVGGFLYMFGVLVWLWVLKRVELEERNLRSHFGRAWDDYAKRVPYQYITGIC